MNTFSKILAAGVVSIAAFSGVAMADDNGNSAFATMVSEHTYDGAKPANGVGYGYPSGFVTRVAAKDGVNVRYLSELPKAEAGLIQSQSKASVKALQASIGSDRGVVSALAAQNVNVSSVVGTSRAFDGSTTYIVR